MTQKLPQWQSPIVEKIIKAYPDMKQQIQENYDNFAQAGQSIKFSEAKSQGRRGTSDPTADAVNRLIYVNKELERNCKAIERAFKAIKQPERDIIYNHLINGLALRYEGSEKLYDKDLVVVKQELIYRVAENLNLI